MGILQEFDQGCSFKEARRINSRCDVQRFFQRARADLFRQLDGAHMPVHKLACLELIFRPIVLPFPDDSG